MVCQGWYLLSFFIYDFPCFFLLVRGFSELFVYKVSFCLLHLYVIAFLHIFEFYFAFGQTCHLNLFSVFTCGSCVVWVVMCVWTVVIFKWVFLFSFEQFFSICFVMSPSSSLYLASVVETRPLSVSQLSYLSAFFKTLICQCKTSWRDGVGGCTYQYHVNGAIHPMVAWDDAPILSPWHCLDLWYGSQWWCLLYMVIIVDESCFRLRLCCCKMLLNLVLPKESFLKITITCLFLLTAWSQIYPRCTKKSFFAPDVGPYRLLFYNYFFYFPYF